MVTPTVEHTAVKLLFEHMGTRTDKAGGPMMLHSLRIASKLSEDGWSEVYVATALLHDIVEDTDCTLDDLRAAGLPASVLDAVEVLTHPKHEPYLDYIRRVGKAPIAAIVKLYDIAENLRPERIVHVKRPEKYTEARRVLRDMGLKAATAAPSRTPRQRWGTCCPYDPECEHSFMDHDELARWLDTPISYTAVPMRRLTTIDAEGCASLVWDDTFDSDTDTAWVDAPVEDR